MRRAHRRLRVALTVVGMVGAVGLLSGCVEGPGFAPPGSRNITMLAPFPRAELSVTDDIQVDFTGANWTPEQDYVVEQCALAVDLPDRCQQIAAGTTGIDGSIALASATVRYVLTVDGAEVPCNARLDPDPLLGLIGAVNGGRFFLEHCVVRFRYAAEPTSPMDMWIYFAGHGA